LNLYLDFFIFLTIHLYSLTYKGIYRIAPVERLKILVATSIGKFNSWSRNSRGKYSPLGEKIRGRILEAIDALDKKPLWHLELPIPSPDPSRGLLGTADVNEGKRLVKICTKVVEFYSMSSDDIKDANSDDNDERRLGVGIIKAANIQDIDTRPLVQSANQPPLIPTDASTSVPLHDSSVKPIDVTPFYSAAVASSSTTDGFPPIAHVDLQIPTTLPALPNHINSAPVVSPDNSAQIPTDDSAPIPTHTRDFISTHPPIPISEKTPLITTDVFQNFYAIRVLASEIVGKTRLFLSLTSGFEGDEDVEAFVAKKEIDLMEVEDTRSETMRREFNLVCWRLVLSNELVGHRRELSKTRLTVQARQKKYKYALHNMIKSKDAVMIAARKFLITKRDAMYQESVKSLSYSHGRLHGTGEDMERDISKNAIDSTTIGSQLSVKSVKFSMKNDESSEELKLRHAVMEAEDMMDSWTHRLLGLNSMSTTISTFVSHSSPLKISLATSAYPRSTILRPPTTGNAYNRNSTDYFRNYASFVPIKSQPRSQYKDTIRSQFDHSHAYPRVKRERVIRVDAQLLFQSDMVEVDGSQDPDRVVYSLYDSSTEQAWNVVAINHTPLPSLESLLTTEDALGGPFKCVHIQLSTAQWVQEIENASASLIEKTLEGLAVEDEVVEEEVLRLTEIETLNIDRLRYVSEALCDRSITIPHLLKCSPVPIQTDKSLLSMANNNTNDRRSSIRNSLVLNKLLPLGPSLHCIVIPVNPSVKASSLLIDITMFPSVTRKYLHRELEEIRESRYECSYKITCSCIYVYKFIYISI
jgi:hypothetical protein